MGLGNRGDERAHTSVGRAGLRNINHDRYALLLVVQGMEATQRLPAMLNGPREWSGTGVWENVPTVGEAHPSRGCLVPMLRQAIKPSYLVQS